MGGDTDRMDAPDGVEDAVFDVDVLDLSDRVERHRGPRAGRPPHGVGSPRAITEAIDRGAVHLVVDLSEATFIDSMTLGVLLGGSSVCAPRAAP